jgi:hypothetical protein
MISPIYKYKNQYFFMGVSVCGNQKGAGKKRWNKNSCNSKKFDDKKR